MLHLTGVELVLDKLNMLKYCPQEGQASALELTIDTFRAWMSIR